MITNLKETLKTVIKDFHSRKFPELIKRHIKVPLNSKKIIAIIGPRRAGKTFLMYQVMSGIEDKTNIVYINFEDERLRIEGKDLGVILDAFFELYPDKEESDLYFFFDEIQEVTGWEKFVRRVHDTINTNIFLTGSSAKLLGKEIATSLRGRTISIEVLPLSFKEYLRFKGIEPDIHSTKGKAKVASALPKYLLSGGFPEIIGMQESIAEKTLQTYFEVMIYRDIAERHGVQNTLPLKELLRTLLSNTSKEFSVNKIFNDFKSRGISISKDTVYKYIDYCIDAYILIVVQNFSESHAKQIGRKVYSIDTGLSLILSLSLSKETGRLLENAVLLELKRQNKEVYSYKNSFECDFVTKKKDTITEAIQVCAELTETNQEREFKGLGAAMNRFKLKNGLMITLDQEEERNNIKIIPAWKWLLQ